MNKTDWEPNFHNTALNADIHRREYLWEAPFLPSRRWNHKWNKSMYSFTQTYRYIWKCKSTLTWWLLKDKRKGRQSYFEYHCHPGFRITNTLLNAAGTSEVGRALPFLIPVKVKRSLDSSKKELKQLTSIWKFQREIRYFSNMVEGVEKRLVS